MKDYGKNIAVFFGYTIDILILLNAIAFNYYYFILHNPAEYYGMGPVAAWEMISLFVFVVLIFIGIINLIWIRWKHRTHWFTSKKYLSAAILIYIIMFLCIGLMQDIIKYGLTKDSEFPGLILAISLAWLYSVLSKSDHK